MYSIPAAMTWEVLSRGRWVLAAAVAGAITLPALILLILQSTGPIDPRDSTLVGMHFAFTYVNAFIFSVMILYYAQGPVARMYAYPLHTSALVAWRMFPAMLIVAGQSLVTTLALDSLFGLNWPFLGPALFMAVVIAWANAIGWLMEKSLGWHIFFMSVVAAVMFSWFQSHYDEATSSKRVPVHYWDQVTVADELTMMAFALAAYCVAVIGVTRNRCGEPPLSLGVMQRLATRLVSRQVRKPCLTTPSRAYFRSELRGKGWVMPAAVIVVLVTFGGGWLQLDRNPDNLIGGYLVGGGWLTVLGVLGGMPMGNTGRSDSIYTMRQFTATLPISDREMAYITLRTTTISVLASWLIWAAALGISYAILYTTGAASQVNYPDGFIWWLYIPATLLGIWTSATTVTAMGLTGRATLWLKTVLTLFATFILVVVFAKLALSPAGEDLVLQILISAIFLAIDIAAVGVFIVAYRRRIIKPALTWLTVGSGFVIALIAFMYWPCDWKPYWLAVVMLAVPYYLTVAPLATFPLAISANRHR